MCKAEKASCPEKATSGLAQGRRCWRSVPARETGNVVGKQSPLEGQEAKGSRSQRDRAGGVSWGYCAQGGVVAFEGLECTVDPVIAKQFLWAKRMEGFQGCPSQEVGGVLRRVEVASWWRPADSGDWSEDGERAKMNPSRSRMGKRGWVAVESQPERSQGALA